MINPLEVLDEHDVRATLNSVSGSKPNSSLKSHKIVPDSILKIEEMTTSHHSSLRKNAKPLEEFRWVEKHEDLNIKGFKVKHGKYLPANEDTIHNLAEAIN